MYMPVLMNDVLMIIVLTINTVLSKMVTKGQIIVYCTCKVKLILLKQTLASNPTVRHR